MKICIYGAGAIGGYLGAELALAGHDVTLIARGPHLAAMQKNGLTLLIGDEKKVANLYDMIHPNALDNMTVRSVFIIGPDKKVKLMLAFL